jgi:2-keto-3-deoxy-L-rhamnonate aldolase RhmA
MIIRNRAKDRLRAGALAVGFTVRLIRTPEIALVAEAAGFEFLLIDREHGGATTEQIAQISAAALGAGITPIVRVPSHEAVEASLALDLGAMGIVMPHVHTAEAARAAVQACKFPPLGGRSIPGGLPQIGYAVVNSDDLAMQCNEQTLLIVMLESALAIENIDEIAAVEGVDVLWIGPNDLCADMGITGQYENERLVSAFERVIDAARRHDKFVGMGGIYDEKGVSKFLGMGVRMLLGGADVAFVSKAARERRQFMADVPL